MVNCIYCTLSRFHTYYIFYLFRYGSVNEIHVYTNSNNDNSNNVDYIEASYFLLVFIQRKILLPCYWFMLQFIQARYPYYMLNNSWLQASKFENVLSTGYILLLFLSIYIKRKIILKSYQNQLVKINISGRFPKKYIIILLRYSIMILFLNW